MKPFRSLLAVPSILAVFLWAEPASAIDLGSYAELLDRYTYTVEASVGTQVDYRALQSSAQWDRLIESLERSRPEELESRDEKLAFWINAYNILAIDLVRRSYPIKSIRDIGSLFRPVWVREAGVVEGRSYSLDEVEHEILRGLGEPRIHFAVVCASISCPALRREPYEPEKLDLQLDESVRTFLSQPGKGLRLERDRHTLRLSRIFDWFEADFGGRAGVFEFVRRYAPRSTAEWLAHHPEGVRIEYLDYDWGLNRAD